MNRDFGEQLAEMWRSKVSENYLFQIPISDREYIIATNPNYAYRYGSDTMRKIESVELEEVKAKLIEAEEAWQGCRIKAPWKN